MKALVEYSDFFKLDIRIGTIIRANTFSKANLPAYIILIDFGHLGILKSSAQITKRYTTDELIGKQVIAIINFKPKQIANIMSECLLLGIQTKKNVILLQACNEIVNGTAIT